MDQSQSGAAKIFTKSRIGRLRYLTYSTALLALLVFPGLLLCFFNSWQWHTYPAGVLLLCISLLLYAFFSVRRLHDFGCSGWWLVLPVCAYLWLLKITLNLAYMPAELFHPHMLLIRILGIAAIFMLPALFPGSPRDNRFGTPPLPISLRTGITAVAVYISLCLVWISIPVGKYFYLKLLQQQAVAESLALAISAEAPLREYFGAHKSWPQNFTSLFPPVMLRDGGLEYRFAFWQSRDGTLVVEVPLHIDGYHGLHAGSQPGWGVAVWTSDGGKTWHCGPYRKLPGTLPESCHASHVPPPRVHWLM